MNVVAPQSSFEPRSQSLPHEMSRTPLPPQLATLCDRVHAPLTEADLQQAHRQTLRKGAHDIATGGFTYALRHTKRAWRGGERSKAARWTAASVAMTPVPLLALASCLFVFAIEDDGVRASNKKAVSVRRRVLRDALDQRITQLQQLLPRPVKTTKLVNGRFESVGQTVTCDPAAGREAVRALRLDVSAFEADSSSEAVKVRAYAGTRHRLRTIRRLCQEVEHSLA